MARIKRKYLDEIVGVMSTEDIKVVTGVRRSGKSILLDDTSRNILRNAFCYYAKLGTKNAKLRRCLRKYHSDRVNAERREVAPLINIPGDYSVNSSSAGTRQHEMQYESIHIIDIADWLLEEQK